MAEVVPADGLPNSVKGAFPPAESPPGPEASSNPVLKAFGIGLQIYEKSICDLKEKDAKNVDDPKNPSLNDEEKRRLSDFYVCRQGGGHVTGEERLIPIETTAGTSHEGIPVEGMIEALKEEISGREKDIASLFGQVKKNAKQTIVDLRTILETIQDNSVSYREARIREGLTDPAFFDARIQAEAKFISEDGLRKSEDPDENWRNAESALERRRELFIPKDKKEDKASGKPAIDQVLGKLEDLANDGETTELPSESTPQPESPAPDFRPPAVTPAAPEADTPPSESAVAVPEAVKVTPLTTEASAKVVEDIDPSYFDTGTKHEHPFYEDLIDDPSSPKLNDLKVNWEKKQKGELYGNQEVVDNMDIVEGLLKDQQLQTLFPKKDKESDTAYRTRLLQNLMGRLRFHGDYQAKKDPLYSYLQQNLMDSQERTYNWDEILMGAECLNALDIQARNEAKTKEYQQYQYNLNQSGRRRSVLTEVDLLADERYPGGGLQPYITKNAEGKTIHEKMPQADVAAFEVVGTILMDVEDPILGRNLDGRAYTYSEVFKHHQDTISSKTATQEQKDHSSKELLSLRESFYIKTLDVLKHRESHNPYREGDQSAFGKKAYDRLQELTAGKSPDQAQEALITAYKTSYEKYHGQPLTPRQELRLKTILSTQEQPGISQDVMDIAIKGGEFMRRRIEKLREPPKLEKVPSRIFRKKFKQAGVYRGPIYTEETSSTVTPPEKKIQDPETAPVGKRDGEGEPEGEESKPGSAPVAEEPEEIEVPMTAIFAAAAENKGLQNITDDIAHSKSVEEELFRKRRTWWNFPQRALDELADVLQKARTKHVVLKPVTFVANLAGGIVNGVNHPIRNLVQKYVMAGFIKEQHKRFDLDFQKIVKDQAGVDLRTSVESARDLMTLSLYKGSENRNKGIKRAAWALRDLVTNPFGIFQTSEQVLAKRWLEAELKKGDQMDPQLKAEVNRINSRILAEVDSEGQRFATLPEGVNSLEELQAKGLSLEQINRDVLGAGAGETRHSLAQIDGGLAKAADAKIKSLIQTYVETVRGGQTDDQAKKKLLTDLNEYLMGKDFRGKLPENYRKEFDGIEVASNILSLSERTKKLWDEYQKIDEKTGQKKWDEFKLDILIGKGEWGGVRGKEAGLEEKINKKLAERCWGIKNELAEEAIEQLKWHKKLGYYAGQYLADPIAYGGSFIVGGFVGGQSQVPSLLVGATTFTVGALSLPFAPLVGTGVLATTVFLKERGIDLPGLGQVLKGRLAPERTQLSREKALRREDTPGAVIRKDLAPSLVEAVPFEKIVETINACLSGEGGFNEQKLSALTLALTEADARMRLSDLSGRKEMKGRTQNFISYREGHETEDYLSLKQQYLKGKMALMNAMIANPQLAAKLLPGQTINSAQEFYTFFDKLSAVSEAQLREGSEGKAGKKVENFLKKNQKNLGLSDGEVSALVTTAFPKLDLQIKKEDSLKRKERNWFWIRTKKGATQAAITVAIAPVAGAVYGAIPGEIAEIWHEGLTQWKADWRQVLAGDVPLKIEGGNLVSDLTTAQKGVLWTENTFLNPPPGTPHVEVIDGVNLTLPGGVEHGHVAGNPDADALVDARTGKILVNMDDSRLDYKDLNGDGKMEMVVVNDSTGVSSDAVTEFKALGVNLIQDPSLDETVPGPPETVFDAGVMTGKGVDLDSDGVADVTTQIPDNTNWQQDAVDHTKWDLHGTNVDGSDRVLIQDATINSNGQITADPGSYDPLVVHIENGFLIIPLVEPGVEAPPASETVSGGEVWNKGADFRVVHANSETAIPMTNYTFPTTGTDNIEHPLGVEFKFPDSAVHNPNTGATEYLHDASSAGRLGLLLQIPHFGPGGEDVAVFVPATEVNGEFVIRFDPTDTGTTIDLPQGGTVTMAELADNFLNEGALADHVKVHGTGVLASETWFEGRQIFNLANPDGVIGHQGRILGGYFDTESKLYRHEAPPGQATGAFIATHAVHGSSPVDTSEPGPGPGPETPPPPEGHFEPVVTITDITEPTNITNLGYRIEHEGEPWIPPLIPIPIRENIEKSVRGEPAGQTPTDPKTQAPSTITPPATSKATTVPVDEEKKALQSTLTEKTDKLERIKKAVDSSKAQGLEPTSEQLTEKTKLEEEIADLESRLNPPEEKIELSEEEKKRLDEMTKQAKEVLNSTSSKSGKKYSEEVIELLMTKIKDDEQIREYLDQSLTASLAEDYDVVTPPVRQMKETNYTGDLNDALQYLRSVCASHTPPITNADELKDFYLKRLSEKAKEQLAEKDPAKRNPALHRMASLAAVMKLINENRLDFTPVVDQDKNTESYAKN